MSADDTPTDPPTDPVVAILSELTGALDRKLAVLGTVARLAHSTDNALAGAIHEFAAQHGRREAAELATANELKRLHQSLDILIREVRKIGLRIGPLESEVDAVKADHLTLAADVEGVKKQLRERVNGGG